MGEHIHLLGAEQVEKAGHNISSAADQMQRAASSMEDTLQRHQHFMSQWLIDLERVIQEIKV